MNPEAQPAFAVWLTGLPASGKSTVASVLAERMRAAAVQVAVLESDQLRKEFSSSPRYDDEDREYFYGSLAFIGRVLVEHGISVVFDATANRRSYRDRARREIPRFLEVFVDCPLEVCARRDPKGIYRMALEGKASNVPGPQAGYEPPVHPDLVIDGEHLDPKEAAGRVVTLLQTKRWIPPL